MRAIPSVHIHAHQLSLSLSLTLRAHKPSVSLSSSTCATHARVLHFFFVLHYLFKHMRAQKKMHSEHVSRSRDSRESCITYSSICALHMPWMLCSCWMLSCCIRYLFKHMRSTCSECLFLFKEWFFFFTFSRSTSCAEGSDWLEGLALGGNGSIARGAWWSSASSGCVLRFLISNPSLRACSSNVCVCVCVCVFTHTQTYTHTYIHTRIANDSVFVF